MRRRVVENVDNFLTLFDSRSAIEAYEGIPICAANSLEDVQRLISKVSENRKWYDSDSTNATVRAPRLLDGQAASWCLERSRNKPACSWK